MQRKRHHRDKITRRQEQLCEWRDNEKYSICTLSDIAS